MGAGIDPQTQARTTNDVPKIYPRTHMECRPCPEHSSREAAAGVLRRGVRGVRVVRGESQPRQGPSQAPCAKDKSRLFTFIYLASRRGHIHLLSPFSAEA